MYCMVDVYVMHKMLLVAKYFCANRCVFLSKKEKYINMYSTINTIYKIRNKKIIQK